MHQTLPLVAVIFVFAKATNGHNPTGPRCPEGDGLYAVADCSNKYLRCVYNMEFEETCPETTYFDRLHARCDTRDAVHFCNVEHENTMKFRQKAVKVDCIGRINGDHPLERNVCHNSFFQCSNGIITMKKCSQGLVFNPIRLQCDYVDGCKTSVVNAKPDSASIANSPAPPVGISCKGEQDGLHYINQNCASAIVYCHEGTAHVEICPPLTVYNIAKYTCDTIYECKRSIKCIGRENGDYPIEQNACNNTYFHCRNGRFSSERSGFEFKNHNINISDFTTVFPAKPSIQLAVDVWKIARNRIK